MADEQCISGNGINFHGIRTPDTRFKILHQYPFRKHLDIKLKGNLFHMHMHAMLFFITSMHLTRTLARFSAEEESIVEKCSLNHFSVALGRKSCDPWSSLGYSPRLRQRDSFLHFNLFGAFISLCALGEPNEISRLCVTLRALINLILFASLMSQKKTLKKKIEHQHLSNLNMAPKKYQELPQPGIEYERPSMACGRAVQLAMGLGRRDIVRVLLVENDADINLPQPTSRHHQCDMVPRDVHFRINASLRAEALGMEVVVGSRKVS